MIKNKVKLLSLAVICAAIFSPFSNAQERQLDEPTLTYLNKADSTIPKSAYSLKEITVENGELPPPNSISKYDLNSNIKKYYQVNINKTTLGETNPEKIGSSINFESAGYQFTFNTNKDIPTYSEYTSITSDIVGNFMNPSPNNGAAHIENEINSISGSFINNNGTGLFKRGHIVDSINADFINNKDSGIHQIGGSVENITGTFIGNTGYYGGAIRQTGQGKIGTINGTFIGNYSSDSGGAISSDGFSNIGTIIGDFIGNSSGNNAGAIFSNNPGTISSITGDFILNSAKNAGAIHLISGATITNLQGDFHKNSSINFGGAIANEAGKIIDIKGDFIENKTDGKGGAIYNWNSANIGTIKGNFIGNSANQGGAILNHKSTIDSIEGNFINNYSKDVGGAIHDTSGSIGQFKNSSFIGNSTSADKGAAIYSNKNIKLVTDNATTQIKDNYTASNDNAIYMDNATSELTFDLKNNAKVVLEDSVDGVKGYKVNISSDNINNKFYLLNDIKNANVSVGNVSLDMVNNAVNTRNFDNLTLTGDVNLSVDVDLQNKSMDRITAETYDIGTNKIHVTNMNLLNDANTDSTLIPFADEEVALQVDYTGANPIAYSPIYKYNVDYNVNSDDNKGYFSFDRFNAPSGNSGGSSNASNIYNPAVLSTPVAAQIGGQAAVSQATKFAFNSTDLVTSLPFEKRMNTFKNKYAVSEAESLPYVSNHQLEQKGFWIKPYTSFENIELKHGPEVDAITYGTLIGFDSNYKELGKGWYGQSSIYGGYNGSHIEYSNVTTNMNGGLLGASQAFYKKNFFTALTANVGASTGASRNMYGNEDFAMLISGVGSKTGYNFEFNEGKYIIQPTFGLNYTFVNTFDYTNSANIRIKSEPLHTLQINPELKFIANYKNGWQPYAKVGYVWNVLNTNKVKASDVLLPKMSAKPFVEYGLGVQRNWGDNFTGYLQSMVRNCGRTGVMLNGGFRWAVGKSNSSNL